MDTAPKPVSRCKPELIEKEPFCSPRYDRSSYAHGFVPFSASARVIKAETLVLLTINMWKRFAWEHCKSWFGNVRLRTTALHVDNADSIGGAERARNEHPCPVQTLSAGDALGVRI